MVAPQPVPFATSSGLQLTPDGSLPDPGARIERLLVSGGPGVAQAELEEDLVDWLRRAGGELAARVASVCNGAFLLARAGILDGRRATTHWAYCNQLVRRCPEVSVEPDPIFVRDGRVWTSAGVTAGMDLALVLVEEDLGPFG